MLSVQKRTKNVRYAIQQGNYWLRYVPDECKLVSVNAKCGIELLNWCGREVHRYNMMSCPIFHNIHTLYKHITENLGLDCPENLNYIDMIKLLRTV